MRRWARLAVLLGSCWSGLAAGQSGDKVYTIDGAASDIHWLVYKAGALARLGHNHAIAVPSPHGSVTVDGQNTAASHFEIVMPVADLVIDDPALRATLGEDFASVPTADDIAGTKHNMLSDRVLNGEMFPTIRVTGTGPVGADGMQTLKLKVELLGRVVDLTVPTHVTVDADRVEAVGEFELNHADLGMKPFSVMMGALQVGEKLSFSYHVVARPAP
jgi:polyisoprenoid-binding protein YceI